jgi:Transglutaminase-like superfamily
LSLSVSAPELVRKPPPLLLIRLAAAALAAPVLIRGGLPRLQRWLEPPSSRRVGDPLAADQVAAQYGRWVDSIIRRGQPLVRPGCLTRGIALYYALRRTGIDVALCFGVGSDNGAVAGHCWLVLDGQPLLERTDPRVMFTEVTRVSRQGVTH